ncbi:MAG: lytic transglycosylase domain-containing protein [Actinomycetota bacterium]
MRRRVAGLFAVALVAGLVAGAVAKANSERSAGAAVAPSPAAVRDLCPVPARYRPSFERAARDTHVPLALLVAVARVESNLDNRALSSAGARGLLQVMPPTAAELRLDLDEPDSDVLAGARYLKQMLARFSSPDLALAAYNAGPGAVEDAGGAPGPETITYVANVNRFWQRFQGCS